MAGSRKLLVGLAVCAALALAVVIWMLQGGPPRHVSASMAQPPATTAPTAAPVASQPPGAAQPPAAAVVPPAPVGEPVGEAAKKAAAAEAVIRRLELEDERLGKVDWDQPRPGPSQQPAVWGKREVELSAAEKAVQADALAARLGERIARSEAALAELKKTGATDKVQELMLARMRERQIQLRETAQAWREQESPTMSTP